MVEPLTSRNVSDGNLRDFIGSHEGRRRGGPLASQGKLDWWFGAMSGTKPPDQLVMPYRSLSYADPAGS
jgi:hypothetical protein